MSGEVGDNETDKVREFLVPLQIRALLTVIANKLIYNLNLFTK